jgi:hypothetical protein
LSLPEISDRFKISHDVLIARDGHVQCGFDIPRRTDRLSRLLRVSTAPDRVAFKAEGMLMWMGAVLPAYEAAKEYARLAKAVELRKLALAKASSKLENISKSSKARPEGALALA